MPLQSDIERAQMLAGERLVVKGLHDQGLCFGPGKCVICIEEAQPHISESLADKLALMIWYLDEVRLRRRGADPEAFASMLDDPEVSGWLEKMKKADRVKNTRFTEKRI